MRSTVRHAIGAKGTQHIFKRFFKNRYGYSRWDGTQRIEGLDADDILNALSDDYLEDGNLQQALRRLMQEGMRSDDGRRTMGLREMMERMRNMRNQQASHQQANNNKRGSSHQDNGQRVSVKVNHQGSSQGAVIGASKVRLIRGATTCRLNR